MGFLSFLLKNLFRRKVRSALTSLGIAVAVGTMVALMGIADGLERSSVQSFSGRGVDLVVVAAGVPDQLNSDLDERLGEQIQHLPGVKKVTSGLLELVELQKGNNVMNVLIQGWKPDSFNFDDLEILSGRRLQASDHRAAMLGATLAKNLNKQVGGEVTIQGEEFKVIGTYQSFSVFDNGSAVVDLAELQALMARKNSVTGFSVILDHAPGRGADIEAVREQIKELKDERGRPAGLSALPTQEYVSSSMHIRVVHAMAWIVTAIAVIIGAIGMLNTMIMSVFERTREIGILRAIGWRKPRVVRMILGEAVLLSLTGAALGSLAAVALTRWLTTFPAASGFLEGKIAPLVVAEGMVMAVLVGLIGGLYPAIRAAQLLPTEALRHE
jgi:putative ABC transport system permease protein